MNLKLMNQQIAEELRHIPEGDYKFQGQLRMLYKMVRMKSLGSNPEGLHSACDVMQYCLTSIHERNPTAEIQYDQAFFGVPQVAEN